MKLSEEGRESLLKAIARGGSREDAARFAGIGTSTLYRLLADGRIERREARERGDSDASPPPGSRWELLEAVKIAESQFRLGCLDGISTAAEGGAWQAFAWLLERKYPHMFGRVARVDVGGAGAKSPGGKGEPVQVRGGGVVVLPPLDDG